MNNFSQMVHKSSTSIQAGKDAKIAGQSEYGRQYQPWVLRRSMPELPQQPADDADETPRHRRKHKAKVGLTFIYYYSIK